MRTKLSAANPQGYNRAGYAWEMVPADGKCHLDFGCHQGRFLHLLADKGPRRLVGVDVDREAIEAGRVRHPNLELVHLTEPHRLPFADGTFDSISALDVIEHVADQKQVLDEFHRVLAPDGVLIVTVPRRYLLSFLDPGNLKFRFPALHRRAFALLYSRAEYERRYAANPDGLIGDVSAGKAWHEHFTPAGLASLLGDSGFEVVDFDGSGFFGRLLDVVAVPTSGLALMRRLFSPLFRIDARLFASMNLFCTARKRQAAGPS
ncbi:MAG: class I SAM-dependent methyltransferase [Planctomycetes bacterium]|nr:class I SAM-dependent methyltransferase [Planctomycetota bacterium]